MIDHARALRALTLTAALSLCLVGSGASVRAQETGGSFESSDWGSGSASGTSDWGSGSSSGGDWGTGSSSGSDWGSSSPSPYPRTDYDTSPTRSYASPSTSDGAVLSLLLVVLVFLVVPILLVALRDARGGGSFGASAAYVPGRVYVMGPRPAAVAGLVDVSMLQLAIDWRARRFVQAELAKLATSGDTTTPEGRARLLAATGQALASVKLAWLYAGARNFSPMPIERAQREFTQIANDVRATFRQEIVRAAAGRVVTVEAVGVRAREHEGPGVVLVSVVVAARREIFDVDATRSASIDALLASLSRLRADAIVAVSVVWTPAAEQDRMSTDELVQRHPSLVRIGDIGGRVFCSYCGGPHAEEVRTCPHCGAPAPS